MPQKTTSRRKKMPYAFIAIAAVLLIALIFLGMRAMNAWTSYEKAAAVTPVPTATVRAVSVTQNPALVTLTPAPTVTPSYLANGSSGDMVVRLQTRLQELGYYNGKIDGQYGSGTKAAVLAFQRQHSLSADGVAGEKTLGMLYSDRAAAYLPTPTPAVYDTLSGDVPLLVNASHSLPDDFVPADLVTIRDVAGDTLTYADNKAQGVRTAVEALTKMIRAAEADGISPWKMREAYRTVQDQRRIFDNKVEEYIRENSMSRAKAISATRQQVADPGCSEHHTGLAFDLNVPGAYFADTAQYQWLAEHCWEYGFIMRYTDDKQDITGILGEEWHVRYVGTQHSMTIRQMGYCLEEYVDYLEKQK